MTNKFSFFLLLLFLLPVLVFSQLARPLPKIQNHESWNYFNKYNQTITDVATDHSNNIWIVTFKSVTRFNGTKFYKIKDPNKLGRFLLRFYETPEGKKMLIDYFGKVFLIEKDTLKPYTFNDSLIKLNPGRSFTDVSLDNKDRLHVGYRGRGYYVIDNGKITQPLKDKGHHIHGYACILREDQLPFMIKASTKDSLGKPLYYYLFDEKLELLDQWPVGENKAVQHNSIVKKKNGNYLYSSGSSDLIEFSKNGFIRKTSHKYPIARLLSDRDDGLWISIPDHGVYYYDNGVIDSTNLLVFENDKGLFAATQDFQGAIWSYSPNFGLRYISHPYLRYFEKEKLPFPVKGEPDLSLYLNGVNYNISEGKISVLIKKTGVEEKVLLPSLPKEDLLHNIYYNNTQNRFFIKPPGALLYYDEGAWYNVSLSPFDKDVNVRLGRVINLIDDINVGIVKNQFFTFKDSVINYLSPQYPSRITSMIYTGDTAYVRTSTSKIYFQTDNQYKYLGDIYPQLNDLIYSSNIFNNQLWVSTYNNGTFILEKEGLKPLIYKDYNLSESIFFEGYDDKVWLINKQGCFEFSTYGKNYDSSSTKLSVYDAVPLGIFNPVGSSKESIYSVSLNSEIGRVALKDIRRQPLKIPTPKFEFLKINSVTQAIHDSIYQIEYNQSFIQISYVSLNYQNVPIEYRYRMLGLNENWTTTDENYTQFTTLPSGKYTFEVQSKKEQGPWSDSKFLYFEILPPFWQTWWFILISGVSIVGLLLWIVRTRELRQQKKVEQERALTQQKHLATQSELKALRAQMNPHFTFNMLNAIQATVNKSEPEDATKYIANTAALIRKVLENSRNTYTSLEKEIHMLKLYIELERFRFSNCFVYKIELDESIDSSYIEIPSMVIQPYIENAIIHGLAPKRGGGQLLLSVSHVNNQLKVIVEDNGIGRKQAIANKEAKGFAHNSMAMGITKDRLALYQQEMKGKASVKIHDLLDENAKSLGTRVELLFPYQQLEAKA